MLLIRFQVREETYNERHIPVREYFEESPPDIFGNMSMSVPDHQFTLTEHPSSSYQFTIMEEQPNQQYGVCEANMRRNLSYQLSE